MATATPPLATPGRGSTTTSPANQPAHKDPFSNREKTPLGNLESHKNRERKRKNFQSIHIHIQHIHTRTHMRVKQEHSIRTRHHTTTPRNETASTMQQDSPSPFQGTPTRRDSANQPAPASPARGFLGAIRRYTVLLMIISSSPTPHDTTARGADGSLSPHWKSAGPGRPWLPRTASARHKEGFAAPCGGTPPRHATPHPPVPPCHGPPRFALRKRRAGLRRGPPTGKPGQQRAHPAQRDRRRRPQRHGQAPALSRGHTAPCRHRAPQGPLAPRAGAGKQLQTHQPPRNTRNRSGPKTRWGAHPVAPAVLRTSPGWVAKGPLWHGLCGLRGRPLWGIAAAHPVKVCGRATRGC